MLVYERWALPRALPLLVLLVIWAARMASVSVGEFPASQQPRRAESALFVCVESYDSDDVRGCDLFEAGGL